MLEPWRSEPLEAPLLEFLGLPVPKSHKISTFVKQCCDRSCNSVRSPVDSLALKICESGAVTAPIIFGKMNFLLISENEFSFYYEITNVMDFMTLFLDLYIQWSLT